MKEKIDMLQGFLGGLEYQIQFRDDRVLQALERGQASFGWQKHVWAGRGGCSLRGGMYHRRGSNQQAVPCSTVPGPHVLIPTRMSASPDNVDIVS